jgi:hypothetical protein
MTYGTFSEKFETQKSGDEHIGHEYVSILGELAYRLRLDRSTPGSGHGASAKYRLPIW